MARKLAITARQVTALCKGASRTGYVPVIQIGDAVVHLVPEDRVLDLLSGSVRDEELEDDFVLGGPPTLEDKKAFLNRSDGEARYLGRHETESEREARHARAVAEWERKIPDSPLNHREQRVMEQLSSRPEGPEKASTLAMAGIATVERLALRGFVDFTRFDKHSGRVDTVLLTKMGRQRFEELQRNRGSYGYL